MQVNYENQALYHPSFFQSYGENEDSTTWMKKMDCLQKEYTGGNDTGIHYDQHQIQQMKTILNPLLETPFNNTRPNLLFYAFYSRKNVDLLDILLIQTVAKWSGHKIGKQSDVDLIQTMTLIYDEYVHDIDDYRYSIEYTNSYIKKEITRLNNLVVDEAVPIIINQVEAYLKYLNLINSPRQLLQQPINTSVTGTRSYKSINELYSNL